jgi:hypothetical protein
MSFGISLQSSPPASVLGGTDPLSYVIERADEAEAAGADDSWLNQGLDIDAITVAALVAREVPRIIVGTAAVPMYPRHPIMLASQAKGAQLAARGRFALGIGLGSKAPVEGVFGVPFDRLVGRVGGVAPWRRDAAGPAACRGHGTAGPTGGGRTRRRHAALPRRAPIPALAHRPRHRRCRGGRGSPGPAHPDGPASHPDNGKKRSGVH